MNIFIKLLYLLCVAVLGIALQACSKSDDDQNKEHFASTQQRALEKAKAVDGILKDADEKQRQQLEKMEH